MVGRILMTCALAMLAACSFNPAGPGDPDGGDDDGDGGGGDGPEPDAACVESCTGDQLRTCTGGVPDPVETCPAGCAPGGAARCAVLVPSNGASPSDLEGAEAAVVAVAGRILVFDTDTGAVTSYLNGTPTVIRPGGAGGANGINFRSMPQGGGAPEIAVFGMATLTVDPPGGGGPSGSLRVIGDRPILLLVRGAVVIGGEVDVGAGRSGTMLQTGCQRCAGAGGGDGANHLTAAGGCAPGGNGNYYDFADETGGGGGGFGTRGAIGGNSLNAMGGHSAAIDPCGTTLIPLRGGSGGGRGGLSVSTGNGGLSGGGGGGALQLTSMTSIALGPEADLYAGGAGGEGSDSWYGGGGGGAGGGFLLEAPTVTVPAGAKLTANGGGGGAGRTANRGENANRSATRASGGAGDVVGGSGGLGGTTIAPTAGAGDVDGTGGGGGAAGIIRVHTVTAFTASPSAIISPPHGTATAVVQ